MINVVIKHKAKSLTKNFAGEDIIYSKIHQ